jgi:hypothetical protein
MPSEYDDYDPDGRRPSRPQRDEFEPSRRYRRDEPPPIQTSSLGVVSLVQGIGSLIASFVPCVGALAIVGGAIGLLLGILSYVAAKKSGRQGTGVPVAAVCLNAFAIVIGGCWLLLMAVAFKNRGEPVADGPEIPITAVALDEAYDSNELDADRQYKNRTLVVSGKVKKITRDDRPGKITVELTGTPGSTVDCHFDRDKQAELNALAVGDDVVIRGRCGGKVQMFVILNDCSLVKEADRPAPKRPDEKPDAPIAITAEALEREYDNNVVAADAKFKGRTVDVTGKVARVARNKPGKLTIELDSEAGPPIECDFAAKDGQAQLGALAAGDTVVVRGTCRGRPDGVVALASCTSVKKLDEVVDGPAVAVAADELMRAYERNVVAADAKYKGKALELTGKVARVVRNRPGRITLFLGAEDGASVGCDFLAKDGQAQLAEVGVGDTVTVRGVCRGSGDGSPTLEKCSLVKK